MTKLFEDVDGYINGLFAPSDPVLEAALKAAADAGLPEIQVSPGQGKLLQLFARLTGAQHILELGTLGAYSTIWLARTLPPEGRMVTLEADPRHAAVARENLKRAGLEAKVELMVAPALDSLSAIAAWDAPPFDLVFIDADKVNYPAYLDWSVRLTRPGAVILADNVIRGGRVLDAESTDDVLQAVRAFNEALAADARLDAIILQQVGEKGHDGLAVAVVK